MTNNRQILVEKRQKVKSSNNKILFKYFFSCIVVIMIWLLFSLYDDVFFFGMVCDSLFITFRWQRFYKFQYFVRNCFRYMTPQIVQQNRFKYSVDVFSSFVVDRYNSALTHSLCFQCRSFFSSKKKVLSSIVCALPK